MLALESDSLIPSDLKFKKKLANSLVSISKTNYNIKLSKAISSIF